MKFLQATEIPDLGVGYNVLGELAQVNNTSILICLGLCLQNLRCLGLFYNNIKSKCITTSVVHFSSEKFVTERGWHYYRTSGATNCMTSESFIHNRHLDMCYMPWVDSKNWTSSKSVCDSKQANLVTVDSPAKQTHLESTINAMSINISSNNESSDNDASYYGCFNRTNVNATIRLYSAAMTIEMCHQACKHVPYIMLETGNRCFCVSRTPNAAMKRPDSKCFTTCVGDSSQMCGGRGLGIGPVYNISGQTSNQVPSVDFYIGLTKETSYWKWNNNQVAVFKSFNDSTSGACAVMTSQYHFRWKSVECTRKCGFICEIRVHN